MKKSILLTFVLFCTTFAFAEYHTEYENTDEMIKGYCEELLKTNWPSMSQDIDASFLFIQDGNSLTLQYSSEEKSGTLSTDNLYNDLENMIKMALEDLNSAIKSQALTSEQQTDIPAQNLNEDKTTPLNDVQESNTTPTYNNSKQHFGPSHSLGIVVGGLNGLSYKVLVKDNFAIQTDLAVGLFKTAYLDVYSVEGEKESSATNGSFWDFTLNPNCMYQKEVANGFSLYAGGGINIGLGKVMEVEGHPVNNSPVYGKIGVNAIVGMEYQFSNVPLALAFDFRPGYGCFFRKEKFSEVGYWEPEEYDWDLEGYYWGNYSNSSATLSDHCFDWKLALALRYCF